MMPSSSNGLAHETFTCEAFSVLTFFHLLRCEAIAVCGEGSFGIWLGEPFFAEEAGFNLGELDVKGFGNAGIVSV